MATAEGGSSEGEGDTVVDAPLVVSTEFWMRAYPRRWREARGQELVDVAVELAGAGARHLDASAAFDLVRGGLATRLREHPPLHTWLLYRVFDRRIPLAHRPWALDDIEGFWYPMRCYVWTLGWAVAVFVPMQPEISGSWLGWYLALMAFGIVVSMFMWPETTRNRARLKHVAPRFGEPPRAGTLVTRDIPRMRVTARSALSWASLFLGITGAASLVAAVSAPNLLLFTNMKLISPVSGRGVFWESGPGVSADSVIAPTGGHWVVALAILLVALGVGVLSAVAVQQCLRRCVRERVEQPYRDLRPLTATGKASVLFWALVSVSLAWLEVSGHLVLGISTVLGSVALLLLPGVLAALVVTRHADTPDLAGRDVWWIATRGRVPKVDEPVRGLRPQP